MKNNEKSVSAVLVTYGARWKLLKQVLAELLGLDPVLEKIIIVDNASEDNIASHIEGMNSEVVTFVQLDENTGSANGFKVGIETALAVSDAEFFWLLDDDNKPGPDALARLIAAYKMMGDDPGNTFVAMRRDRQEFLNAALHGSMVKVQKNSFMGFHLGGVFEKVTARLRRASKDTLTTDFVYPVVSIGFAPYGGFFFHRSWIEKIGLPNEQFFLYGDDHDFTSRVITHGGKIYLCAAGEVEDLEMSWNKTQVKSHRLISPRSSSLYVYYSTRNRVYFEVTNYVTSSCVYHLNMLVMMFILLLLGIVVDKKPLAVVKRWKLLWAAIRAGESGRLGKVNDLIITAEGRKNK